MKNDNVQYEAIRWSPLVFEKNAGMNLIARRAACTAARLLSQNHHPNKPSSTLSL
jgi:hypothetical protein